MGWRWTYLKRDECRGYIIRADFLIDSTGIAPVPPDPEGIGWILSSEKCIEVHGMRRTIKCRMPKLGRIAFCFIVFLLFFLWGANLKNEKERLIRGLIGWKGNNYINNDRETWVQTLSWRPRSFLVRNLISEVEAKHIAEIAWPRMQVPVPCVHANASCTHLPFKNLLNKNCYYTLNNERFRDRQLSKRMEPAFSMIIERALGLSSNGELNHCPFLLP